MKRNTESANATHSNKAKRKLKSKSQATKSDIIIGAQQRKNQSEVCDHFEKLEQGTCSVLEDDDFKRRKCKRCNI